MEHKRAKFLIEKSGLSDKDKLFLNTHIDMMENSVNTLGVDNLQQKDIIDYNQALNNNILTVREKIASLSTEDATRIEAKLDEILKMLNK